MIWGQNLWGPQKFPPPKASLPFDGVESSCDLKHAKAALGSVRNPPNWGLRLLLGSLYVVCLLQEFKVSPFRSSGCCLFFLVADPPKNVTVSLNVFFRGLGHNFTKNMGRVAMKTAHLDDQSLPYGSKAPLIWTVRCRVKRALLVCKVIFGKTRSFLSYLPKILPFFILLT